MRKIRIGLIFGGKSGEHEVSLASAESVLQALDRERYEVVPIGVTREGRWLMTDSPQALLEGEVQESLTDAAEALPDVTQGAILRVDRAGGLGLHETAVDVVFPLLHGPYGEDGTVQGLLELAGIPYVGSGVLASAACMDKVHMKTLLAGAGLSSVPYMLVLTRRWRDRPLDIVHELEERLAYPMFVKPCNMGSSVGITKAHDRRELEGGINTAALSDRRIIVEQGIEAREIECSVLGNDDPLVSVPGEVRPHGEFYDYEAKYTEGMADLIIPAPLTPGETAEVQELARRAFLAVDAGGLARVDFFLRPDTGFIVNEVNTMPGFTTTSMYPKLWERSGLSYSELIDRLIQLALERHEDNRGKSGSS